jgi:short subunit dehydrogenase-like uncharacterized protein
VEKLPIEKKPILIYGAYGYTGELIVSQAIQLGLKVIVAGRNATKLASIANQFQVEQRVFSVENTFENLKDVALVLNCAGPFSETALSMAKACIRQKVHYLDITGEIDVFKACHALDQEAKQAGVLLLPGVGFDIVPTDCLANLLHEKLPKAIRLDLAFSFGTAMSIGTAKTSAAGIGKGGLIRQNHQIVSVANAFKSKKVAFQNKTQWCASIPWGDVFTSGISTGVPNGMVYMQMPLIQIWALKIFNPIKAVFDIPWVLNLVIKALELFLPKGPKEHERQHERSQFWGEIEDEHGKILRMSLSAPNVYSLTATVATLIAKHCISKPITPGYQTPAMLLGAHFISSIDGVTIETITK